MGKRWEARRFQVNGIRMTAKADEHDEQAGSWRDLERVVPSPRTRRIARGMAEAHEGAATAMRKAASAPILSRRREMAEAVRRDVYPFR